MRHATRVLPLILLLVASCGGRTALEAGHVAYLAEIETWHAEREAALAAEDGWLSLVGLHPIAPGVHTVGSGPEAALRLPDKAPAVLGTLEFTDPRYLVLETAPGTSVVVEERHRTGRIPMLWDAKSGPTQVAVGTLRFFAIERGGEIYLRVKDSENPTRLYFAGIERFPVDPRWRVEARLVEREAPKGIVVPDVLGHLSDAPCPGRLVFTLDGKECSLWPIGKPGEELFIVFADATSGTETYGAGRFLSAPAPDAAGRVALDFNRAVNPPCAFSAYATCPLPPEKNKLRVAVRAGEKIWGESH